MPKNLFSLLRLLVFDVAEVEAKLTSNAPIKEGKQNPPNSMFSRMSGTNRG